MTTAENKKNSKIKVCYNHMDLAYTEESAMQPKLEDNRIIVIEAMRKNSTKNFDHNMVEEVKKQILFWKTKYPNAIVEHFFQFRKGKIKSNQDMIHINNAQEIADKVCFYEQNIEQSVEDFENSLVEFMNLFQDKEKQIALEIESSRIIAKIIKALNQGITSFFLIGGEYGELEKWISIVNLIRKQNGKTTGIPYSRMNTHTKESKIKFFAGLNFDYMVHGLPPGGKVNTIRYLDTDLFYKSKEEILEPTKQIQIEEIDEEQRYSFSRAISIVDGNKFAKLVKIASPTN